MAPEALILVGFRLPQTGPSAKVLNNKYYLNFPTQPGNRVFHRCKTCKYDFQAARRSFVTFRVHESALGATLPSHATNQNE